MAPHAQDIIDQDASDQSTPDKKSEDICVQIPDLFSSIMSVPLRINPHYFPTVRAPGYERIRTLFNKDAVWSAKNESVELGLLCSTWAPGAPAEALETLFDYNHWVFLFDDQFDEGHLSSSPHLAALEIQTHTSIMHAHPTPLTTPLHTLWSSICTRVRASSPPAVYHRFCTLHTHYFTGLPLQLTTPLPTTVSSYLSFRLRTIGVLPAFPISEYALGVNIPQHAYNHPSVQEIMHLSAEMVILVNDIASYKKDRVLGVGLNMICVMQKEGLSMQEAMDRMGAMLEGCYKRWYGALARMPVWGESVDGEVLRYVEICRDVALGCLHWSFLTGRYLGMQGGEVRRTRRLWISGKEDGEREEMGRLYDGIAIRD
ncbi:hypothetical protein OQA88_12204 [Cercophora sp. LCS_1]